MDIKKYIESGILELYAKDQLNDLDAEKVNALLGVHLELGEELEHIYSSMEG
ncbi:hypothetical protein [Pedobacter frigiditerrae]|uniref:hypothetical protein n=1 Tax=Pedobacter frigiditerrae TaxID=2530452 RepID=UPI0013F1580A|nr:hypothetical protein [Pedobacter frigiditerrae]